MEIDLEREYESEVEVILDFDNASENQVSDTEVNAEMLEEQQELNNDEELGEEIANVMRNLHHGRRKLNLAKYNEAVEVPRKQVQDFENL